MPLAKSVKKSHKKDAIATFRRTRKSTRAKKKKTIFLRNIFRIDCAFFTSSVGEFGAVGYDVCGAHFRVTERSENIVLNRNF